MIINHSKKFVFIHVPKNAGSSIRSVLSQVEGNEAKYAPGTKHETVCELKTNYSNARGVTSDFFDTYAFYAFVRNPWDRFRSLHRYLHTPRLRSKYPKVPYDVNEFAAMLLDAPDWFAKIRSLRPQTDYLNCCDPWVGRFETLEVDFNRMCKLIDIEGVLQHKNSSSRARIDGNLKKRLRNWFRHPAPADRVASALNRDSIGIIEHVYRSDIERFGYSPP